jgi:uncharacterized protein YdhG (YjbR/CyaY superfamily)
MKTRFSTQDEYFSVLPSHLKEPMSQIRLALKDAVPDAQEVISYQMPALRFNGILVYYAAFKNHIGYYPTNSGILAFEKELRGYNTGKGSVQFPLDKPMPLDLISEIARFRYFENLEKKKNSHKS